MLLILILALEGCSVPPSQWQNSVPPPNTTPTPPLFTSTPSATSTVAPTLTPRATQTALAPTVVPTSLPTTSIREEKALTTLVQNMQRAVLARNRELYLSYIDLSDPVFGLEHTRWADEWSSRHVVDRFSLELHNLTINRNQATGDLTMSWVTSNTTEARTTTYPVEFRRGSNGQWRYAGEQWVTFDTTHFIVHTRPGLERVAQAILTVLPEVYDHDTTSLEYVPTHRMEIKLYDSPIALVANTLLSLPDIHGWNEPGESLKLVADPKSDSPPTSALAHEFTHFIEFEMAGTAHSRMPWWLSEGLAVYTASHFENPADSAKRLDRVREWAAGGELVAWAKISDFESTPVELWRNVYPQGEAFVRYVTETFGLKPRNAWLRAMSVQMDLPQATRSIFEFSFEELDARFVAWLKNTR